MTRRGYRHSSRLDESQGVGASVQNVLIDPLDRQLELLRHKGCIVSFLSLEHRSRSPICRKSTEFACIVLGGDLFAVDLRHPIMAASSDQTGHQFCNERLKLERATQVCRFVTTCRISDVLPGFDLHRF